MTKTSTSELRLGIVLHETMSLVLKMFSVLLMKILYMDLSFFTLLLTNYSIQTA